MRLLPLFATLLFIDHIAGQDTGAIGLVVNGRFWSSMSGQAKAAYVIGIGDGMAQVPFHMAKDCSCALDSSIKAMAAVAGGHSSSYMDLVRGVDDFYKDPTNRAVPVIKALQYVTLKIQGANSRELEDLAAGFRREANQ